MPVAALRWFAPAAALSCLLCTPAFAVDGVIEINQTCAVYAANGCFPGDAAEPPVTINQPGSYRLTSNLYVEAVNLPAVIEIRADHVTLDLNGFSISGPTLCTGTPPGPVTCAPTGTLKGIDTDTSRTGIVVRNGVVRGMPNDGVDLEPVDECHVEHIHAVSNALDGIVVGRRSIVASCRSERNGSEGIEAAAECSLIDNVVAQNDDKGIVASGLSLLARNVITGNGSNAIDTLSYASPGGSLLIDNTVTHNGGGAVLHAADGYARNVFRGNGASEVAGGIQIGINLCGSNTTCP